MSKFKVGDRVKVYGTINYIGLSWVYTANENSVGVISKCRDDGLLEIPTKGAIILTHPKQCRKLVPSTPRQRFWVNTYRSSDENVICFSEPFKTKKQADEAAGLGRENCIEFVEVRKKRLK